MKLLDVVHPAAKTLVDISLSQDSEVRHPKRAVGLLLVQGFGSLLIEGLMVNNECFYDLHELCHTKLRLHQTIWNTKLWSA
jgi:hypothetical protein